MFLIHIHEDTKGLPESFIVQDLESAIRILAKAGFENPVPRLFTGEEKEGYFESPHEIGFDEIPFML